MTKNLSELQEKYKKFIKNRNWEKYHTPKSLAMSISIESNELMEIFQWHDNLEVESYDEKIKSQVKEELADIILYSLRMADRFDIDIIEATDEKLEENKKRYNIKTSKELSKNLEKYKK